MIYLFLLSRTGTKYQIQIGHNIKQLRNLEIWREIGDRSTMDCQPKTERKWKNPTEVMRMRKKKVGFSYICTGGIHNKTLRHFQLQRKPSTDSLDALPTIHNKENSPLTTATGPGVGPVRELENFRSSKQFASPTSKVRYSRLFWDLGGYNLPRPW